MARDCGKGKSAKKAVKQTSKRPWLRQGYLMVRAPSLVKPLEENHKQSPYIKQIFVPKTDGSSTINMLTTNPSVLSFFNGRPVDYSQLVPHIELYKVYIHNKEEIEEYEFPFKSFSDFTKDWPSPMKNILFRGRDAGIQSIDVKMEGRGRNPVSANVMDIKIKFFFNDTLTLFKRLPKEIKGHSVSYSDLIRYPPSMQGSATGLNSKAFRIRLRLGWSMLTGEGSHIASQPNSKDFVSAVQDSKISITADLYTHQMEFNSDGSLTITAHYKGALESAFSSQVSNILRNQGGNNELNKMNAAIKRAEDSLLRIKLGERYNYIESTEKLAEETEKLYKYRDMLDKAAEQSKDQFPKDLLEQFKKVEQATNALRKKYPGSKSPIQALTAATKDTTAAQIRDELRKMDNNLKAAEKRSKALKSAKAKGRSTRKKVAAQKKAIKALRTSKSRYERAMKGKHLFSYVEFLRTQNKIAYVTTGRKSEFNTYVDMINTAIEKGGSESSAEKINRLQGELEGDEPRSEHRYQLELGPMWDEKEYLMEKYGDLGVDTVLSLQAGMSLLRDDLISDAPEPDTIPEKAATKIKKKPKRRRKGKRKVSRGTAKDAVVWDFESPRWVKGDKLYYFRLGDLLTSILEKGDFGKTIEEESPNFKVFLGEYDIPESGNTTKRFNLYNLPISLEIFHLFVAQKIVGTGRKNYPLLNFTFDLIKFVMDKTQSVFSHSSDFVSVSLIPPNFKMDLTSIDLPSKELEIALEGERKEFLQLNNNSTINTLKVTSIKNTSNCFVLHSKRKLEAGEMSPYRGDIKEDEQRGIFHFFVGGPDRGILKKIDFKQAGNSLFSTALMRNGQSGGAETRNGVIKPSKFSCELTLVGNPFFFIGQMIYINTSLISGGNFEQNVILNGGYYVVTAVENIFTNDRWETKIKGVLNIPDHAIPGRKERLMSAWTSVGELDSVTRGRVQENLDKDGKALNEATNRSTKTPKIPRTK